MTLMSVMMASGYGPFGDEIAAMSSGDSKRRDESGSLTHSLDSMLGKDAFLRLLTTQLRYQDPMNPVDDQDFIAQMAQFSALEQMQNLTATMERFIEEERATNQLARATALLGRSVEIMGEDRTYVGVVEGIQMEHGVPWLMIGGMRHSVYDVIRVEADS